jgi:hypothetical protein
MNELRARRPVNGPVDSSAAQQRGIGCIDDGIHVAFGDVAGYYVPARLADVAHPTSIGVRGGIRHGP